MQTLLNRRQVRLVFHRSLCRPVKIRVEAESPRSADRIASLLPAGSLLSTTWRVLPSRRPRLRVIRTEPPPEPDWRIVGDHRPEPATECEAPGL